MKRKDANWETSNGILSKILLQVGDHGDNTFFYMTILMIFRNVRREPGLKKNGLSERLQTEKQNITLNIVNFYTKTTSRQRAT